MNNFAPFDFHPDVAAVLRFFSTTHLPEKLRLVSQPCADLANHMAKTLPQNGELPIGLRKLLEAKDCFVRASLDLKPTVVQAPPPPPPGYHGTTSNLSTSSLASESPVRVRVSGGTTSL